MNDLIRRFKGNLRQARHLGGLYTALRQQTTQALDLSDLLRAELVMAVSALDHFIHEVTRQGMLDTMRGKRPPSAAFRRFDCPMDAVMKAVEFAGDYEWFDSVIRSSLGWRSFQHPDKIADAIRLITDVPIWEEVSKILSTDQKTVRSKLMTIVERRNKIAHEADVDAITGTRLPIDEKWVTEAVRFIESIGVAIGQVVEAQTQQI